MNQEIARLILTFLILTGVSTLPSHAVGSGGLLNLVPQAQVWVEQNGSRSLAPEYSVYVHPLEGSLILVHDDDPLVLALDKNKHHTITMEKRLIDFNGDQTIADVHEETPYTVVAGSPHFNRTYASVTLDDGRKLIVQVER